MRPDAAPLLAVVLSIAGCASSGPDLDFDLRIVPSLPVAVVGRPIGDGLPAPEPPPAPARPDDQESGDEPVPPPPAAPEEAEEPEVDEFDRAIADYDRAALERLFEAEADRLEGGGEAALDDLRRLGRVALHLAEIWKFQATVAPDRRSRRAAVQRRLEVAGRGSAFVKAGLGNAPDDGRLLFYQGELLAYLIDGLLSGLKYGRQGQALCERAVAAGAGPEAALALAKRFYYLPSASGGDLGRAAREVEAILEESPDCEPAWAFLGQIHQTTGDRAAARRAFEKAVELNPKSLRGTYFLEHPDAEPVP